MKHGDHKCISQNLMVNPIEQTMIYIRTHTDIMGAESCHLLYCKVLCILTFDQHEFLKLIVVSASINIRSQNTEMLLEVISFPDAHGN